MTLLNNQLELNKVIDKYIECKKYAIIQKKQNDINKKLYLNIILTQTIIVNIYEQ